MLEITKIVRERSIDQTGVLCLVLHVGDLVLVLNRSDCLLAKNRQLFVLMGQNMIASPCKYYCEWQGKKLSRRYISFGRWPVVLLFMQRGGWSPLKVCGGQAPGSGFTQADRRKKGWWEAANSQNSDEMQNSGSSRESSYLSQVDQVCTAANIPLHKSDNPLMREFLQSPVVNRIHSTIWYRHSKLHNSQLVVIFFSLIIQQD